MIYINKNLIFVILILTSCAHINYSDLYNYAKISVIGVEDIKIDDAFVNDSKSSFIKVKLGKTLVATLVLANVNNNIFEWVGSNGEKIITKNGRIIETNGLEHNMQLLNLSEAKLKLDGNKELLISLYEPSATISQIIKSYDLGIESLELDKTYVSDSYREDFTTSNYKWSGSNFYWVDKKTSLPIKTIASSHPYLDNLEIEFYYLFGRK